jgi:hypothetical protein
MNKIVRSNIECRFKRHQTMFVNPQFKCSKVGEDSADDIMIVGFEYFNTKNWLLEVGKLDRKNDETVWGTVPAEMGGSLGNCASRDGR